MLRCRDGSRCVPPARLGRATLGPKRWVNGSARVSRRRSLLQVHGSCRPSRVQRAPAGAARSALKNVSHAGAAAAGSPVTGWEKRKQQVNGSYRATNACGWATTRDGASAHTQARGAAPPPPAPQPGTPHARQRHVLHPTSAGGVGYWGKSAGGGERAPLPCWATSVAIATRPPRPFQITRRQSGPATAHGERRQVGGQLCGCTSPNSIGQGPG